MAGPFGEKVHRSDPSSGLTTTVGVERTVGAVAPRAGGGLVAAVAGGFATLDDIGRLEMLVQLEADKPHNRMNDGKCAPDGSFWAGTMDRDERAGAGTLYRLAPDLEVSVLLLGLPFPTVSAGPPMGPCHLLHRLSRRSHRQAAPVGARHLVPCPVGLTRPVAR